MDCAGKEIAASKCQNIPLSRRYDLSQFRRLMTSASDGGRASVVDEVVLMVMDSVAVCVFTSISVHCLR
jgi:hypothetical protein